jgi:predicted NAD/FAD-dependent oxidoreductase
MAGYKRIAIIGAGISGLTLASEIRAYSPHAEITVFDKSRGLAGRMATRRADPFAFDHGTQFLTARTPEFQRWLNPLLNSGHLAEWTGKVIAIRSPQHLEERPWPEPHYVPAPAMTNLCKHLASEIQPAIQIALNVEVAPLFARETGPLNHGWHLFDAGCNFLGAFDWVLSTAPPVQTRAIFAPYLSPSSALREAAMQGCFTLMLGMHERWNRDWILAKIKTEAVSPIALIAIDSTKPGRNRKVTSIVVHSRNDWAQAHIDDDRDQIQAILLEELVQLTGIDWRKSAFLQLHRWRYAIAEPHEPAQPFLDLEMQLASTGDWCTASRVEDAWLNARRLAAMLRNHLEPASLVD